MVIKKQRSVNMEAKNIKPSVDFKIRGSVQAGGIEIDDRLNAISWAELKEKHPLENDGTGIEKILTHNPPSCDSF